MGKSRTMATGALTVRTLSLISIRTLPSLLLKVWKIIFLLVVIGILPELFVADFTATVCTVIQFFADFYLLIYATIFSFSYWGEEEPQTNVNLKLVGRVLFLMLRIYSVTAILLLPVLPALFLFMLSPEISAIVFVILCIPGLLYFANRSLALYVFLFEKTDTGTAIKRSRDLMTIEKWYSIDGPLARLSLVMLPPGILYFFVAIFSSGNPVSDTVFRAIGAGSGLSVHVLCSIISWIISVLMINIMTGFYLDVKRRAN